MPHQRNIAMTRLTFRYKIHYGLLGVRTVAREGLGDLRHELNWNINLIEAVHLPPCKQLYISSLPAQLSS